MSTIPKNFGRGGAGLTPDGTSGDVSLYDILCGIQDDLESIKAACGHSDYGILGYTGIVSSNTCTQASGTGATTWTVDVAALDVLVAGTYGHVNAQSGLAVHGSTQLVADGQSIYVWLVEKKHDGSLSTVAVKGTAATSGSETIPTEAQIVAALAADETYTKLALLHVARVGTTMTETIDMSYREQYPVAAIRRLTFATQQE